MVAVLVRVFCGGLVNVAVAVALLIADCGWGVLL